MRVVPLAWSMTLGVLALAAPLAAQERPVNAAELDAALQAHAASVDADRAAVRRALDRPEVADKARQMGIDLDAAQRAVATLEGEPLVRAAAVSADLERALAGGETYSINATTLIIVLLIIILVVLIAD